MRTVLFIVHGFPPMGGAGVQRVVKFIKYLPEFDWQSVVLTAEHDLRDIAIPDVSLQDDLPGKVPVYRRRCPDPYSVYRRLGGRAKLGSAAFSESGAGSGVSGKLAGLVQGLMVPDTKILWLPGALAEARKILARHAIDVIVSSSPWETVHLIAARLAQLHGVGWLADLRDPWSQAPWNPRRPGPLRVLNLALERMTLRRADGVVVTSQTTADGLRAAHEGMPGLDNLERRLHLVYNGYDEPDFAGLEPKRFERFTIVYAGRAMMPGRSPEPLLAGLAELRRRNDLVGKIDLVFVGPPSSAARALVARHGLADVVRFAGYRPHRESLTWLLGADLLYLNTIAECIPGKFTEYLRSGRPIVAVMDPECEVAGLITKFGAGDVVPPGDPAAVADVIERRLKRETREQSTSADVVRFSRRRLTGQLAGLLEDVLRQRKRRSSTP